VAIKAVISFLRMRKENEATPLKEVVFVLFDSRTYEYYRSALEEKTLNY
jgi:hypothetical protein